MKHKIALLSDVHGNQTALEAVLEDAKAQNVTDYWFLGDLIMPGPGANTLFTLLDDVQTSVFVKGNWEDCFLAVIEQKLDLKDASDVYIGMLGKHVYENLDKQYIDKIYQLPLHTIKEINGLKISISHNLPNKNYGPALVPNNQQENFDQLFINEDLDIAIYGHVHHQTLRYSSTDQLIINPGTIGQPFSANQKFKQDTRAQYALLEIDDSGITNIEFKKVFYNQEKEIERAKKAGLPYFNLYEEQIKTTNSYTHNHEILAPINIEAGYLNQLSAFLDKLKD